MSFVERLRLPSPLPSPPSAGGEGKRALPVRDARVEEDRQPPMRRLPEENDSTLGEDKAMIPRVRALSIGATVVP